MKIIIKPLNDKSYYTLNKHEEGSFEVEESELKLVPFQKVIDIKNRRIIDNPDYKEPTKKEIQEYLRVIREQECFPIINRGKLWYDNLTELQIEELKVWYQDWLNVTDTLIEPTKPTWL